MDGNKDEALKCLKIGQQALDAGDKSRALKFISKAHRLDPNLEVNHLLSSLQSDEQNPNTSSDEPQPRGIPSLKKRAPHNKASTSSVSVDYTEEQVSIVRTIKKQKDYYEILGIEKDCSVEEVRKAYRKLSLKVHPDKNKAPGAEDAFKAVSKAFQCLSNEESRRKYDVSGTEEVVYDRGPRRRGGYNQQGFNGFYETDFDPDEIFRNFFYGGGGRGVQTQFGGFSFGTGGMGGPSVRTANNASGGGSGSNLRALIQLLPILLIVLLNFLPSNEPVFALSRSYPYEVHYKTMRGVNYYVKSQKFEQQYPPNSSERVRLENQIDRDYYSAVSQNCRAEMQRKNWGFTNETPHCEMLRQFKAATA